MLSGYCNASRSDSPPGGRQLAMHRSPSTPPDGVVHLIIRKTAGVHWRHQAGAKLELSISADATAEAVAAKLEAANDLPAKQHCLTYNGEVSSCSEAAAVIHLEAVPGWILEQCGTIPRCSMSCSMLRTR